MDGVALPRIRTKRKRRKPPGPGFWWWLFWVIFDILWSVIDITHALMGEHILLGAAGIQICALVLAWKLFRIEWKKWRDGD